MRHPRLKQFSTFRLDAELIDALKAIKDRDGIPVSEQARRALRAWVECRLDARGDRRLDARPEPPTEDSFKVWLRQHRP